MSLGSPAPPRPAAASQGAFPAVSQWAGIGPGRADRPPRGSRRAPDGGRPRGPRALRAARAGQSASGPRRASRRGRRKDSNRKFHQLARGRARPRPRACRRRPSGGGRRRRGPVLLSAPFVLGRPRSVCQQDKPCLLRTRVKSDASELPVRPWSDAIGGEVSRVSAGVEGRPRDTKIFCR